MAPLLLATALAKISNGKLVWLENLNLQTNNNLVITTT